MSRSMKPTALLAGATVTFALTLAWQVLDTTPVRAAFDAALQDQGPALQKQTQADVDKKSAGCLTCHNPDRKSMHATFERAGCTDCHGGDAGPTRDKSLAKGTPQFKEIQRQAHVQPTLSMWKDSS